MDENMNNEVINEERNDEGYNTPVKVYPAGPSKGFAAVVVGGLIAAGVAVTMAIKKHKRKKAENETVDVDFEEEDLEDDLDDDPNCEDEQPSEK